MLRKILTLLIISTFTTVVLFADETDETKDVNKKINNLQKQLDELKAAQKSNNGAGSANHLENFSFSGDLSVFAFTERNPVYAAGRASEWQEYIGHFKSTMKLDGGHEANLRIAALSTVGDDIDSYGPRAAVDDDKLMADEINIYLKGIGDENLNVRVGRQTFSLGDGWLISDGFFDSLVRFNGSLRYFDGIDANYKASDKLEFQAYFLHLSNSYLQFDESISAFAGGGYIFGGETRCTSNLGKWALGATRRHDKSRLKNETILMYLRGDKELAKGLDFHVEYAIQKGKTGMKGGLVDPIETGTYRRDAWAINASIKKTFTEVEYKPWLELNYIQYSGDEQSTSKTETWDPLFYNWGYTTGAVNNTNLINERFVGGAALTDKLSIQAEWRDYYWDRLRPGYTNRHYADLTAITVNYVHTKSVFFGAFAGWLDPHQAGTNYFDSTGLRNNRTIKLLGAWVVTVF